MFVHVDVSYTDVYVVLVRQTMDLFSEDLFNVFEETEKPTPGKIKKRKREAQETGDNGARPTEDSKKVKVDSAGGGGSASITSSSEVAAGASREGREENKDVEPSQDQNSEV